MKRRMTAAMVILAMVAGMFGALAEMDEVPVVPAPDAIEERIQLPVSDAKENEASVSATNTPAPIEINAGEMQFGETASSDAKHAEGADGTQNKAPEDSDAAQPETFHTESPSASPDAQETGASFSESDNEKDAALTDANEPEAPLPECDDETIDSEEPDGDANGTAPDDNAPEETLPNPDNELVPTQAPEDDSVPGSENEAGSMMAAEEQTDVASENPLDGTTSAVDNSTPLADGSYAPEDFSYSGGTGRTRITCSAVQVSGGRATARIAFSSANYQYVKASGGKYDARHEGTTSIFEIPIALNVDNRILAMTTGMSETGIEIEYTILVKLTETANAPQQTPGEDSEDPSQDETTENPEEPKEEPVYEDGEYEIGIDSTFKMFVITSKRAKVEAGKIIVTIGTSKTTYDRIFIGSKNDESSYSNYVQGAANSNGGYDFTFELPQSSMGASIDFVPGKADGSWYSKNQYQLTIPATIEKIPGGEDVPPIEEPTAVEDGDYNIGVDSSSAMFKVIACRLTAKGGAYSAVITLSGTGYDKLYMGTAEVAAGADASALIPFAADSEGKYTFTVPVAKLDEGIAVAAHSIAKDLWYDRTLTFKSEGMEKIEVPAPDGIEDGDYNIGVDSSSAMFKVIACRLTAKGGAYSAVITLSGTGYDKLYMGTAEVAAGADASALIPFAADSEGKYTFTVPVAKLDEGIAVAAHSIAKDLWYDRTLTFKSEGMEKIEAPAPEETVSPEVTPSPTPAETASPEATPSPSPEPTATPEADLNGSTSRVDSSTTLADGTYAPDKFSFSGGTGKVRISCTRITVSGGKATATIVFSSPNYGYVKANGRKYHGSHGGGTSTFEIPIKLNSNNRIIGMTEAMSVEHEVSYTLYFYIKAADQEAESAADANAPEITGLTFRSKDALEAARLFEIYRYEGGFIAIKVADAGIYMLVPEGAELPVGLEAEMTAIQRPVESAYVAFEETFGLIAQTGSAEAMEAVRAIGYEGGEELPVYAGSCMEPDYAALLRESVDLAIVHEQFADARVLGTANGADAQLCEGLSDEDAALMADVAERLDMLGIPMFVDRSMDEESERARLEWIKVYGLLFDCEAAANARFEAVVAELPEAA